MVVSGVVRSLCSRGGDDAEESAREESAREEIAQQVEEMVVVTVPKAVVVLAERGTMGVVTQLATSVLAGHTTP